MIRVFFLMLTFWLVEPKNYKTERVWAVRKGVQHFTNLIPIGASDFTDLVKRSKMFVDNSKFIQDILDSNASRVLFFCPSQWGKTMNLGMIRAFFEMPVDEKGRMMPKESTFSYKLFTKGEITADGESMNLLSPLLIASNKTIMEEHYGRYPIINVTFKDAIGDDYQAIEGKVRQAICRAFKEHEYLKHALSKPGKISQNEMQDLMECIECKNTFKIERSLHFLAELLNKYFTPKIVLLIDDFDVPLCNVLRVQNFTESDLQKVLFLMKDLSSYTFKSNVYYHRAIVFATHQLSQTLNAKLTGISGYMTHLVALRHIPMHEYFGFNRVHVQDLYDKRRINAYLGRLGTKWYNGYEARGKGYLFYDPTSIIRFLNKKQVGIYKTSEQNNFIKNVLKTQPAIRISLFKLISQESLNITLYIGKGENSANDDDIYHLKRLTDSDTEPPLWQRDIFFRHLLFEGYLTRIPYSGIAHIPPEFDLKNLPILCAVKLPNIQTAYILSSWLVSFYEEKFNIQEKHLEKAVADLFVFFTHEFVETEYIEESLEALYKASDFDLDMEEDSSLDNATYLEHTQPEHPIIYILNCVLLRMQCITRFELDVFYNKAQRADFVTVHNRTQQGCIVQLSFNDSAADDALDFAEARKSLLQSKIQINKIKFIGINIAPNRTVNAQARLMIRDLLLGQRVDSAEFDLPRIYM